MIVQKFLNVLCREFLLWSNGNESNQYPWGYGFDPWPCSVHGGSGVALSCGVGCRCGLDPVLLRCRPVAVVPIWSLAWKLPHTKGAALKSKKKKKNFLAKIIFLRATPVAYGSCRAGGWITAAGLYQLQIWAASVTYTAADGNARSLIHWARPGVEPPFSWILVRFLNCWATMGMPVNS